MTLENQNTQLDLNLALISIQGTRVALSNQRFQMDPNNPEPILRAPPVNSQNKVGWQNLPKARFSKQGT
jgi:hypothetical protein